jgi:general secretion pathway protein H
MTGCGRTARRDAGYTLLEMLVVVAILAGVMSVTYVSWHGRRADERLDIVADKLRLALLETRTAASRDAKSQSLFLDLDRKEWRTADGKVERIPDTAALTVTSVRQSEPGASLREAEFRFTPDGSSTGGTIRLADGGQAIVITVDWLTGRIGLAKSDE